jgi:hypothetical protein
VTWPGGREALASSLSQRRGALPPGVTLPDGHPDAEPIQRVITLRQPEAEPIPLASMFNTLNFKTTVAVEAGINIPGCEFVCPKGYVGRLDSVLFGVANLLLSSVVTFTVTLNGAPLAGLSAVGIFPGVAARVTNTFTCFIRLPVGAQLAVVYTNTDGGTYTVGAGLSGWMWPEAAGASWMQVGR